MIDLLSNLIPAPYRLLALGLALAAAVGAVMWWGSSKYDDGEAAGYKRGHAEWVQLDADMTRKALDSEQEQRQIEQDRIKAQKENADEAQRISARDRATRTAQDVRTGAADERVRGDVAAITARSGESGSSAAAAQQCAADIRALGAVFDACRAEYRGLARDADAAVDDARQRGIECAADYDSLTVPSSRPIP